MLRTAILIAALIASGSAAHAQTAAPCRTVAAPPAALSDWSSRTPLGGTSALTVGKAADVELLPTAKLHYAVTPGKPPSTTSYGAAMPLAITEAGTYRVALSIGAWIDMVRDGKALASIAHNHGPRCTGIHKIVDFTLTPGRYTLQIEGSEAATAAVLVVKIG